jgi:hypothetical protein
MDTAINNFPSLKPGPITSRKTTCRHSGMMRLDRRIADMLSFELNTAEILMDFNYL